MVAFAKPISNTGSAVVVAPSSTVLCPRIYGQQGGWGRGGVAWRLESEVCFWGKGTHSQTPTPPLPNPASPNANRWQVTYSRKATQKGEWSHTSATHCGGEGRSGDKKERRRAREGELQLGSEGTIQVKMKKVGDRARFEGGRWNENDTLAVQKGRSRV